MKKYLPILLISSLLTVNLTNAQTGSISSDEPAEKKWVLFRVDSVLHQHEDSVWVIINGGEKENIIPGNQGNTYSAYSSEDPDRGTLILGTAYHISSEPEQSSCFIVLDDPSNPALSVFKNDLVELQCLLPPTDESFLLTEIVKLGIQFNDLDGNPIYTREEILFNTDWQKEEEIMNKMSKDVVATLELIQEFADENPSWSEPMQGGKYAGLSLLDAMNVTTPSDIAAFLNFVIAFPGKYMGNTWKINETYATWLINDTPEGEFNHRTLRKINDLEGEELDRYIEENAYYIQDSTLEKYNEYFDTYLQEEDIDKAEEWNNKLILISTKLGNKYYKSIFKSNRGFIKASRENWEGAVQDYNEAIQTDPENFNAYYLRGSAFGEMGDYYHAVKDLEQVSKAMPDIALVEGNKGWYQMLDGKIFDALASCRNAYELDPNTSSYALNLGHAYLLLGDTSSARNYYDKTLDLLGSQQEFHTGLADFDIFLEKGWQPEFSEYAKVYMLKRYKENYSYYLLADSLLSIASSLSDEGNPTEALPAAQESFELEKQSKNPRNYYLYVETSWIGYIYHQLKQFEMAEQYYKKCLYYAHDVLDDDKKTANVYDLMSMNYEEWGKMTDYYACREKMGAYKKRDEEAGKNRNLYLLAAGNNESQKLKYHYADRDVDILAEVLTGDPSNYYDSVVPQVIHSEDLTMAKLEKAIRKVIVDSRPDDVFILYLGGTGSSDSSQFLLELPKSDSNSMPVLLGTNTIKTWLSSVQARNQFLVFDLFSPTFIDEFIGTYTVGRGALSSSNLNLGIISLSGHRLEVDSLEQGLLTHFVVDALKKGYEAQASNTPGLSINKLNALLTDLNYENDGIISWNTYQTGDDFILVNYDSTSIARSKSISETSAVRGVGSLSLKENEEFFLNDEGKNYALLFATDSYDEWDDLVNPVFDAKALANTLEEFYSFEVELMTDNTRVDILKKIRDYQKRQYHPNDQLFIFFAGHGAYDDISGEGYIVCKDSKKEDEIRASYIAYSYLRENVNNIRSCNHILIALDVCFGGTFDKKVSKFARGSDDYSQIGRDEFIQRAMRFRSRLFITSGSKEYVSDGEPGKHSPFAYRILDVLRSQGMMNDYVTFNLLVQSVERLQTTPRYGDFGDNEPGSEFIFSLQNTKARKAFKVVDLK